MARTLKDDQADDWADTFANAEEFAEQVYYQPAGGGTERQITALVERVADVTTEGAVWRRLDELVVTVGRNEDHAKGGVARPQPGDRLRRATDANTTNYAFTGEVIAETPASFRLRFVRPVPVQAGVLQSRLE